VCTLSLHLFDLTTRLTFRKATDVSANLHNKVSKSISITEALLDVTDKGAVHAARFLKEMHDQKEIEGKTSSERSQQSPLIASADDPNSRQASRPFITTSKTQPKTPRSAILHSSTVPIADLRTKLAERKSTERSLKANLSLISSVTSTSDLRSTVDALKTQKEGLLERLT
jgi:hypothetical protein